MEPIDRSRRKKCFLRIFQPRYARWQKGEVDHVGFDERSFRSLWVVEIKWSNRYFERPAELKSLLSFCNANNLSEGVVTTIDKQGVKECQGIILTFIPAAVYAYVVAKNTLIQNGLRFGGEKKEIYNTEVIEEIRREISQFI